MAGHSHRCPEAIPIHWIEIKGFICLHNYELLLEYANEVLIKVAASGAW